MKNVFFTFLAVAALAGCASTESKHATEAAVKVEIRLGPAGASASGSHLGGGRILTNKHVCDLMALEGAQSSILDNAGQRYNVLGWYNSPQADIDLCLVSTNARDIPTYDLDPVSRSYTGELVTVTGYPAGAYGQMKGYVLGSQIFFIGGGAFDMGEPTPEFLTAMGMVTAGGVSGSGVIGSNGKLVGVVNAGGGDLTLFVPLSTVREFLTNAVRYLEN